MQTTEVRKFIQGLLIARGDAQPFTDEEPLFSGGRLQSIDATEVVLFLEDDFGVDFNGDFDRDQIDSIEAICRLLTQQPRKG